MSFPRLEFLNYNIHYYVPGWYIILCNNIMYNNKCYDFSHCVQIMTTVKPQHRYNAWRAGIFASTATGSYTYTEKPNITRDK